MERAGPHLAPDPQMPQAPSQLVGRLAAERADEHVVPEGRAVVDAAGHPQREDPGLAGPGPGQDAEQRVGRGHRLVLGRRQAGGTAGVGSSAGAVLTATGYRAGVARVPAHPSVGLPRTGPGRARW